MFVALDKNNNRIYADFANKEETYFCPMCKQQVFFKKGKIKVAHFAHVKECLDNWHYEMTEWHQRMQSYFPKEWREVVITHNGETHRADVLNKVEHTVYEFQKSPISPEEYQKQTKFFLEAGYKVIWVFAISNVNFDFETNHIYCSKALKCLSGYELPSDNNPNLAIWVDINPYENNNSDKHNLYKIIKIDAYDNDRFKNFFVSTQTINANTDMCNTKLFFKSSLEYIKDNIQNMSSGYSVKTIQEYESLRQCERFDKRTLPRLRENVCRLCQHCHMIVKQYKNKTEKTYVYCCYPNTSSSAEDLGNMVRSGCKTYLIFDEDIT